MLHLLQKTQDPQEPMLLEPPMYGLKHTSLVNGTTTFIK